MKICHYALSQGKEMVGRPPTIQLPGTSAGARAGAGRARPAPGPAPSGGVHVLWSMPTLLRWGLSCAMRDTSENVRTSTNTSTSTTTSTSPQGSTLWVTTAAPAREPWRRPSSTTLLLCGMCFFWLPADPPWPPAAATFPIQSTRCTGRSAPEAAQDQRHPRLQRAPASASARTPPRRRPVAVQPPHAPRQRSNRAWSPVLHHLHRHVVLAQRRVAVYTQPTHRASAYAATTIRPRLFLWSPFLLGCTRGAGRRPPGGKHGHPGGLPCGRLFHSAALHTD